ncbi:MAG: J domain-containing protein [Candidatus Omnitrophota bacterium]|nr:MAG: J domain-containing protein [Candidatus Omnitrophota bacterium]
MAEFEKIDKARKILNLGERATLKEIKEAYRRLSLKYHPDKAPKGKEKEFALKFNQITEAYNILIAYCKNYPFSFRKEDVKRVVMEEIEEDLKRFYDDWWEKL